MFRKIAITAIMLTLSILGINAQLLYKISGKDIKKPSYIVGTFHVAPSSFVDSIPGLRAAMDESEQICGELDMKDMMSPEGIQKMMAAMMLEGDKTVKDILTADEMNRLNAYLRELLTIDFTNPMLEQQMGKMTPAALGQQLTLVSYIKKTPGFNPQDLIDNSFQKYAQEKQKPIIGLETLDFQINTLFKGKTIERQKELLFCIVDNPKYNEQMLDEMAKAYFALDLKKLKEIMDEKENNKCDSTPAEEDALFGKRNRDWLTKMPAIMSDKSTLFHVGAGHLPGSNGVLQLLTEAGYKVEAVK
ncbi:MAG: TraB/GumN family protein [Prevotella sp.]